MPLDILEEENLDFLQKGFKNLKTHIENMKKFGSDIVVAINNFATDTEEEIDQLKSLTKSMGVSAIKTNVYTDGSSGGIELANEVINLCQKENDFNILYEENLTIKEKIEKIAKEIYRAKEVIYTKKADKEISRIEDLPYTNLPICVAKTPYSFSDDPNLKITDTDYDITIKDIRINAGAGFIVAYTSNILTMPGLPKEPNAYGIEIDSNDDIIGLS